MRPTRATECCSTLMTKRLHRMLTPLAAVAVTQNAGTADARTRFAGMLAPLTRASGLSHRFVAGGGHSRNDLTGRTSCRSSLRSSRAGSRTDPSHPNHRMAWLACSRGHDLQFDECRDGSLILEIADQHVCHGWASPSLTPHAGWGGQLPPAWSYHSPIRRGPHIARAHRPS